MTDTGRLDALEDRLAELTEQYAALLHELRRVRARGEIENLFAAYEQVHGLTDIWQTYLFFARHTPDTWCEVSDWGRYTGFDEIKALWTGMRPDEEEKKGMLFVHGLMTPNIVVAGDGLTAKATWLSSGHETKRIDGELRATWCWGNYAIDFVNEDGVWRIWHFKWFRTFITDYYTSWVDRKGDAISGRPGPQTEHRAEARFHRPYTTDSIQLTVPPPPAPFESWTDADVDWHVRTPDLDRHATDDIPYVPRRPEPAAS